MLGLLVAHAIIFTYLLKDMLKQLEKEGEDDGIPAGDPDFCRVLGLVMEPWHRLIDKRCPQVRTWAYVDDRSMKARPGGTKKRWGAEDEEEAKQAIEEAFSVTEKEFDERLGLKENKKKRQVWTGKEDCEHLGLRAQAASHWAEVGACRLRANTNELCEVAKKLFQIPGPATGRENWRQYASTQRCVGRLRV